jgi:hypothetical protein
MMEVDCWGKFEGTRLTPRSGGRRSGRKVLCAAKHDRYTGSRSDMRVLPRTCQRRTPANKSKNDGAEMICLRICPVTAPLALHFAHYNSARVYTTLRVTTAMAARVPSAVACAQTSVRRPCAWSRLASDWRARWPFD